MAPHFDPYGDNVSTITAWIRFPGLPIEYYNNQALMKLGALVGKALFVDNTTLNASRGKYARVCVELDLRQSLLAKYRLKNRVYRIEYEGASPMESLATIKIAALTENLQIKVRIIQKSKTMLIWRVVQLPDLKF